MLARLFAVFFLVFPAAAFEAHPTQTTSWKISTVSLEIRNPDGTAKKFTDIPWSLNMTVLDTMKIVDDIKFTAEWYKSLGEWLITSIDGIANQGAGKANWLYSVNGSPACVGASSYILGPKASIVWVYDSTYPKCP
jgi:hypothetical protein